MRAHGNLTVGTTVKNPQSNAIVERLHKTVGDILRTYLHSRPVPNVATAVECVNSVLAAAQCAMRATVHQTMESSPGAAVFGRDMFVPLAQAVNMELVQERRQAIAEANNRRENARRTKHVYAVGDRVLILTFKPNKMAPQASGPFVINQVHGNGTVTIQRSANTTERLNIRRVRPFRARA